ncbi:MAG: hypothetical protein LBJ00_12355 [Planctomycetaceae bacterium]|nr:hypothetical protein [Planctomycetaceae bacterium]
MQNVLKLLNDAHYEFRQNSKTQSPLYTQAVLKFPQRSTQSQQREAVAQGLSLSLYRLRHTI